MLTTQQIIVHHVASAGMAFGYTDEGVGVYVPRSIVSRHCVKAFEHYSARLVPNQFQPEKTPLMAVYIEASQPEEDPVVIEAISETEEPAKVEAEEEAPTRLSYADISNRVVELALCTDRVWTTAQLVARVAGDDWVNLYPKAASNSHVYLLAAHNKGKLAKLEVRAYGGVPRANATRWCSDWRNL